MLSLFLSTRPASKRSTRSEEVWLRGRKKTYFIEWRSADGKLDRLPVLAAELVHLKVDIIVTGGRSATRAAKEATSTIPIVMTQDSDPVGQRVRRQPGATGREHYWIVHARPRAKRKTTGAYEGDHP